MSSRDDPERCVRLWVEKAENDLRNAEHTLAMGSGCPFDTVCFHTQQCAERYLKALPVARSVVFPKTHDLLHLLRLVPEEAPLDLGYKDVATINRYAIEARYPGHWEPIDRDEAVEAVDAARHVRAAVRALLPEEDLPDR